MFNLWLLLFARQGVLERDTESQIVPDVLQLPNEHIHTVALAYQAFLFKRLVGEWPPGRGNRETQLHSSFI